MWHFEPIPAVPEEPTDDAYKPEPEPDTGRRRVCESYLPDTRSTLMTSTTRSALSGGGCVSSSP